MSVAYSCIYDKNGQQKRHHPSRYDLPLGCTNLLKKSLGWFFQPSLQAAQVWVSPGGIFFRQHSWALTLIDARRGPACDGDCPPSCATASRTLTLKEANLRWCSSGLFAPSAFLSSLSISCDSSLAMFYSAAVRVWPGSSLGSDCSSRFADPRAQTVCGFRSSRNHTYMTWVIVTKTCITFLKLCDS